MFCLEVLYTLFDICKFMFLLLWVVLKICFICVKAIILSIIPYRYKDITNDVVLITGGGKGVGHHLALEFAKYKPKQIILWGRHIETLEETARRVRLFGVACSYMTCDVSCKEEVYEKASELQNTNRNVTILVNNAGVVFGKKIIDSDPTDIETTFQTNTFAHFWTAKAFLPSMLKCNKGHIVNMNSLLGLTAVLPGAGDYAASKWASNGLAEALHQEITLISKNIYFTNIHPYLINTEMFAGCESRFQGLLPPLDAEYVASKSVKAVLRNQHRVIMPAIMSFSVISKSILPGEALGILLDFFGLPTAMSGFHKDSPEHHTTQSLM